MMRIGVDIGGQHTRIALVQRARIVDQQRFPTPQEYPALLDTLTAAIDGLREEHPVTAVGLGLPGRFDPDTHVVQRALNLPFLEGHTPDEDLANRLRLPVALASDVGAAAVGQHAALPGAPHRFLYLSLGTGVGGALVVAGKLQDLSTDGPAHFGHVIVDTAEDAPACACGARGCLEACVRGPALSDPARRAVAGLRLGLGVLQLVHLLRAQVVMLGGGVLDHDPNLLDEVRAMWTPPPTTLIPAGFEIRGPALATDQAGVLGAATLAGA